jgi:hypothetical protein
MNRPATSQRGTGPCGAAGAAISLKGRRAAEGIAAGADCWHLPARPQQPAGHDHLPAMQKMVSSATNFATGNGQRTQQVVKAQPDITESQQQPIAVHMQPRLCT